MRFENKTLAVCVGYHWLGLAMCYYYFSWRSNLFKEVSPGEPGKAEGRHDQEGEAKWGWGFRWSSKLSLIPLGALEGNTFQVCTTSEYRKWAFTFPHESAIGYALLWEVENSQARLAQITGDTALASSGNSLHVAGVSHEQYSRLWACRRGTNSIHYTHQCGQLQAGYKEGKSTQSVAT